jgi:hypothetical protein
VFADSTDARVASWQLVGQGSPSTAFVLVFFVLVTGIGANKSTLAGGLKFSQKKTRHTGKQQIVSTSRRRAGMAEIPGPENVLLHVQGTSGSKRYVTSQRDAKTAKRAGNSLSGADVTAVFHRALLDDGIVDGEEDEEDEERVLSIPRGATFRARLRFSPLGGGGAVLGCIERASLPELLRVAGSSSDAIAWRSTFGFVINHSKSVSDLKLEVAKMSPEKDALVVLEFPQEGLGKLSVSEVTSSDVLGDLEHPLEAAEAVDPEVGEDETLPLGGDPYVVSRDVLPDSVPYITCYGASVQVIDCALSRRGDFVKSARKR